MSLKKLQIAILTSFGLLSVEIIYAHGSLTEPMSRSYYCRFMDSPENPQSGACQEAKAISGTTQLFYDWMGILQANANSNHQNIIPDGKLCSGGDNKIFANGVPMMEGYNAQSDQWQWPATTVVSGESYPFVFKQHAPHATKYFKFYMTKDGYDPSQALKWSDLEDEPFCQIGEISSVEEVVHQCQMPLNKEGHHVIYTIWQRSLSPEAFYACSDIVFGDEYKAIPSPTPTPQPDPNPDTSPTNPANAVCHDMRFSSWNNETGQLEFSVTPNEAINSGWKITIPVDGITNIVSAWNGNYQLNNETVNITSSETWNQTMESDREYTFGFQFNSNSVNQIDVDEIEIKINQVACNEISQTPDPVPDSDPVPDPEPTPNPDPGQTPESHNYTEVLYKSILFYDAQRAGRLDEKDRLFVNNQDTLQYSISDKWRNHSVENDGSQYGLDEYSYGLLSGGYFDAGDHVKFGQAFAYTSTVLSWGALEFTQGYKKSGQLKYLLDRVEDFVDYILKAYDENNHRFAIQVSAGGGDHDHGFWGAPENIENALLNGQYPTGSRPVFWADNEKPASEITLQSAAALVSAYLLFDKVKDQYPEYLNKYDQANINLISKAEGLFALGYDNRDKNNLNSQFADAVKDNYRSYSGHEDEIAWSAAWFSKLENSGYFIDHGITPQKDYTQIANETISTIGLWYMSWDNTALGAGLLLAEMVGDPNCYQSNQVCQQVYYSTLAQAFNKQGRASQNGAQGFDYILAWGALRHSTMAGFNAMIYGKIFNPNNFKTSDAFNYGKYQLDYALGNNPWNRSFVIGYGNNYPLQAHHRGASGLDISNKYLNTPNEHILYGALVGGPYDYSEAGTPNYEGAYNSNEYTIIDGLGYADRRYDWIGNEVTAFS